MDGDDQDEAYPGVVWAFLLYSLAAPRVRIFRLLKHYSK